MAKHDENRDLRSFSRIGRVNLGDKTLKASKNAVIGIHMWGKIDYLTKYCGWHLIWDNSVAFYDTADKQSVREQKKVKKEHKLTDKRK